MGLANVGMGNKEEAAVQFKKALQYDFNHQNCRIYLKMVKEAVCWGRQLVNIIKKL